MYKHHTNTYMKDSASNSQCCCNLNINIHLFKYPSFFLLSWVSPLLQQYQHRCWFCVWSSCILCVPNSGKYTILLSIFHKATAKIKATHTLFFYWCNSSDFMCAYFRVFESEHHLTGAHPGDGAMDHL